MVGLQYKVSVLKTYCSVTIWILCIRVAPELSIGLRTTTEQTAFPRFECTLFSLSKENYSPSNSSFSVMCIYVYMYVCILVHIYSMHVNLMGI